MSSVTQMGMLAQHVGVERPASAAAAAIVGIICVRIVSGPVIQSDVPSATAPARRSMAGAIAAMMTFGAAAATYLPSPRECLARVADGLTLEERHQDGEVVLHVAGRLVKAHAPHAFDHDLVREPDAEREPVTGRLLGGEGLLGEHHRVAWIRRDDGGAEVHARDLASGDADGGDRVEPKIFALQILSNPRSLALRTDSTYESMAVGMMNSPVCIAPP